MYLADLKNLFHSTNVYTYKRDYVQAWFDEKQWYNIASNTCTAPRGEACGHYTQVVWADTTHLGCAEAECKNVRFGDDVVETAKIQFCNYGPGGNIQGQKPYVVDAGKGSLSTGAIIGIVIVKGSDMFQT